MGTELAAHRGRYRANFAAPIFGFHHLVVTGLGRMIQRNGGRLKGPSSRPSRISGWRAIDFKRSPVAQAVLRCLVDFASQIVLVPVSVQDLYPSGNGGKQTMFFVHRHWPFEGLSPRHSSVSYRL